MNQIFNNNNNDCGCEEDISLLNRNNQPINNMPNNNMAVNNGQMNNMPVVNNQPMNNNMPVVNNQHMNNNMPINNQHMNNNMPINNQPMNNNGQTNDVIKGDNKRNDIKLILSFLLALSIHEMIKFFINQSIRLNKGTSARYIYYPIGVVIAFILISLY